MRRRIGRSSSALPRLHVNLAAPGYRVARWLQLGLVAVLAGSIGYGGWCWVETQRLTEDTAQQATSVARVQAMNQSFAATLVREGLTRSPAEVEQVYRRVDFANQFNSKRRFSWTRLLNDLGVAIPTRASIQSVRLDFKEGAVQLRGRVLTLRDLDTLVNGLERHRAFQGVQVVTHRFQDVDEEDGSERPVRPASRRTKPRTHRIVEFELTAGYETGIGGATS